jgi:hypothetical protein
LGVTWSKFFWSHGVHAPWGSNPLTTCRRYLEQARVLAERRRLRAQRNLAAAVVVFLLAIAGAGAWFVAERARQAQRQHYVNAEVVASLRTAAAQRDALHDTLSRDHLG